MAACASALALPVAGTTIDEANAVSAVANRAGVLSHAVW